ncbi:MAG: hypothetical protein WBN89_15505 [Prochlorococcaceae cyanobacterium]
MPVLNALIRSVAVATGALALASCGPPDPQALQRLACEQAGANIDIQSLGQLDTLRKAMGVAPGVDPIEACRSVGVELNPPPATPQLEDEPQAGSNRQE